ncbi:MAG: tRNA (adenosine(37)-N6)-dimethylallyltransferase MiaA [Clostridiales bacterium]|jgi:tRNA dimethylallyltransferase|nr:tRNA (adenosine(37)-N6)-dimethylallyltransferase MiaA [Clostridiales bacterium]
MTPIYFIAGPTACGKTQTAVNLALETGGEVISADSMQVYRFMDIGTAKPTSEEMKGIPHHLIDILRPDEKFSVAAFQKMASAALNDILSRGKTPIIAGGTGFYLNSLLYGVDFPPEREEPEIRSRYRDIADSLGLEHLHNMLGKIDPIAASGIHPNNVKRVIRALEYYELTGQMMSERNEMEKRRKQIPGSKLIILYAQRSRLYERINERVDAMYANGLLEEVKTLLEMGYGKSLPSMQALGYKETIDCIEGRLSFAEAAETVKASTRRYAKRQLTWFRHKCNGLWIDVDECNNLSIIKEAVKYNDLA